MKLTVQVQLKPTAEQSTSLTSTIQRANAACNWLSKTAWETKTFRQLALHRLAYYGCRAEFSDLSSQVIVRCIAKVADSYKLDRKRQRAFRTLGAITYDARILSWVGETVSIWTVGGRQRIPFVCGDHQRELLVHDRGESDLVVRDGRFYLLVSVDIPDTEERKVKGWLGVDLGIRNLAFDSDGEAHSGAEVLAARSRVAKLRAGLQSAGTRSAKRHLKKLRGKEQRFQSHTNHVISKSIVRKAKDTERGIALEDLTGIRDRVTVRKNQRTAIHSWAFWQLRAFISYKALAEGVAVEAVDPRYTSQSCPECGTIDKANRKSQSEFVCIECGFADHADHVGARNIASRAEVNRPIVANVRLGIEHVPSSPQLCQLQSLAL